MSQLAAWRRQAPEMADLYISVNLSGAQLHDAQIVDRVADVLALHGLEGSSLCLELTESVVMEDPAAAAATLAELRRLGVRIAIDDFGSEYSSLAYLKRFPVTTLKIDKSFVDSLARQDSADATLIATIVAMAQALGITHRRRGRGDVDPGRASRRARLRRGAGLPVLTARRADRLPRGRDLAGDSAAAARDGLTGSLACRPSRRAAVTQRSRAARGRAGAAPARGRRPRRGSRAGPGPSAASRCSAAITSHHAGMLAAEPRYGSGPMPS